MVLKPYLFTYRMRKVLHFHTYFNVCFTLRLSSCWRHVPSAIEPGEGAAAPVAVGAVVRASTGRCPEPADDWVALYHIVLYLMYHN